MAELPKNVVKSRSDLEFKRRARSITALVLCVLVLLPMLRIGYIMIAHGGEYRKEKRERRAYERQRHQDFIHKKLSSNVVEKDEYR